MKRPYFQFYPSDWKNDERLQLCSLAARGLWLELMGLMHNPERYGYLIRDGKPMTIPEIAVLVRATTSEVSERLAELQNAGVPGIDAENGAWFSRRMIRDERERRQWNKRQRNNRIRVKMSRNSHADVTPKSRRSSSSSSSSPSHIRSSFLKPSVSAPAPPEIDPVAYWDSALQAVVLDEDWLRGELAAVQTEAHVHLTREEFESEREQLRLAVIADPRLRACIRKANGKPSSESQFHRFASYTSGWFKRAILRKARSKKNGHSRNQERKAKTDEALREVMREALEEEANGEKV